MNKKYFILLIICMIFVIESTSADVLSACGTLSNPGYYEMNQSISSTTTCLTIASSNVDLNCNGSTISYNTAGGATNYGINAIYLLVPLDNITIRNCDIRDTTAAGTPSAGIQFTRVTDSYIFNNTIQTNGTTLNHGVVLTTGCKRNRIENNTINTLGSGITNVGVYLTTEASNNNITGNNVVGIGTLTSYAVYLAVDSNDNLVKNNNLSTISTTVAANSDPHVLVISSSKRNDIFNNYIYGQGDRRGYAVYVATNAESTNIENNSILMNLTPTGTTGYGIYLLRTPITSIKNNNISLSGTGTLHGVYMTNAPYVNASKNRVNMSISGSTLTGFSATANSPYSEIKENNVTINGVGTINGIAITSSGSSVIEDNLLILTGSSTTINGIITTDSPVSYVQNNNISISGTTTLNGISATTSYASTVQNNNISISGTTTLNGILATSSRSLLVQNNSINIIGSASTTTAPAVGIYFSSSSVGTVKNNSVGVSGAAGSQGIYLYYNSLGNLVEENVVSTYGTGNTNPGIYLTTGSNENTIQKNVITTSGLGTTNYGVYILTSSNNVVYLNNISTSGTTTNYGVYLLTQAGNNTVMNNIISTYGTITNYGIYVNSANYNKLIGNNITANGSTRTAATTTSNHGIAIGASSYFSEVYNNTIYNDGVRYNYGIYSLTNSRWGVYSGNDVHTAGTENLNVGAYISESHYNTFENNVFSTSGSTTNHGVYLHSSARGNIIETNNISTSGGTDSHAFGFLYVAAGGYPENNIIKNNNLLSISGRDLDFATASTNGTILIDQIIGNYSFTGTAGTLTIRNESVGEISFSNVLSGSGTTFSDKIFVWPNLAGIDESVSALNKSAVITFYNVSTTSTELQIYRNGVVCPETICINITPMQSGNVTFNVTRGGNYSILQTSALPTVILDYPNNNFNSSSQNITFNFTVIDDSIGDLNCSIYINSILNQTNTSVSNGTITNFIIQNLQEDDYTWQIGCYDSAGNRNVSEERNFSVIISRPTHSFNYPGNNSYINEASFVLLNHTVFDSDLRNMTVYLYGDDILINTSENITNGTELIYNWTSLGLGQHNWSIETSNGFKNSTRNHNYFNLINLTVNCEAGGPYQENALILVKGNVSDGTNYLTSGSVNVSVLETLNLISIKNVTIGSDGSFETSFSNLSAGSYSLNVTGFYLSFNKSCADEIIIGNSAGLTIEKIASFYELTSTNVTYNISLKVTNIGGNNATGVFIYDEDYIHNPYDIGTLVPSQNETRSYLLTLNKTSVSRNQDLAIATTNATNYLNSSLIEANSELISVLVPALNSGASLVIDKIVSMHNLTNETIAYNITLRSTNKGGSNATNVVITDSDSSSNPYNIGDIAINNSNLISYIKTFVRNSTNYNVTFAIATINGTDSYDNSEISASSLEIILTIPETTPEQQISLIKNAYYLSENSTTVTYNLSIEVVNSGGVDLNSITLIDSDLSLNEVIDLNRTISYSNSSIVIIDKAASNTNKLFVSTTATVNSVTYSSNQILVRIPGYGGPADAIVYAPTSVLTSTSFDTNITVENQNLDIGQDFVIDYWITNSNETTNYSSGQQTIYVGASSTTDITATLTSPSSSGSYKFMSLVTWIGGTATSYDSFEVTAPSSDSGNTGGSSSGGSSDGAINSNRIISGNAILDSDGIIQIVDYPNNIILLPGENKTEEIIIKNAGNKTLHNVKVIISGLPLEFYSVTPNEVDIEPMDTQTYIVVFTPTEEINKYFFKVIISSDEVNKDENAVLQVKTSTIEERKTQISSITLSNLWIYLLGIAILLIIILLIKKRSSFTVRKVILIVIPIILAGIIKYFSFDNIVIDFVKKIFSNGTYFEIILYLFVLLLFIFALIMMIMHKPKKSKYPRNTVLGLMKKKVYTDSGHYVGRIKEVIVHKNKVDSLIIKLNKKTKIKGVIIRYKDVISIGEIVIVNYKHIESLKNM